MKGCILRRFPEARIIDLTHEIVVHWPAEAGFWLARAFEYFPPGTVHIAVVDPGVGTSRDIVAVACKIMCSLRRTTACWRRLWRATPMRRSSGSMRRIWRGLALQRPSATFHGRDIFAPLAAELAAGRCLPADLGEPAPIVPAWVDEPTVESNAVTGVVITIDHFGNLISNIDGTLLGRFRQPLVQAGNHVFRCCAPMGMHSREIIWHW